MQFYKKKVITRGTDEPYLIRYSIFSCRFFAIKVHHILVSDDACLHSHPWPFISFILRGGYTEQQFAITPPKEYTAWRINHRRKVAKWYGVGSLLYRHANSIHRLILPYGKTAWTLVITFRKIQSWGFFTPAGYVNWRDYNNDGGCES